MSEDHQELIQEVKKIAKWADFQRKMTKWSLIAILAIIPMIFLFPVVIKHYFNNTILDRDKPDLEDVSWYDVDRLSRRGDIDNAIEAGQKMIEKVPSYWIGHRKLGHLYLTSGDLNKSLQHFEEAFRLFPSEENEDNLKTIKRRIEMEDH